MTSAIKENKNGRWNLAIDNLLSKWHTRRNPDWIIKAGLDLVAAHFSSSDLDLFVELKLGIPYFLPKTEFEKNEYDLQKKILKLLACFILGNAYLGNEIEKDLNVLYSPGPQMKVQKLIEETKNSLENDFKGKYVFDLTDPMNPSFSYAVHTSVALAPSLQNQPILSELLAALSLGHRKPTEFSFAFYMSYDWFHEALSKDVRSNWGPFLSETDCRLVESLVNAGKWKTNSYRHLKKENNTEKTENLKELPSLQVSEIISTILSITSEAIGPEACLLIEKRLNARKIIPF